MQMSIAALGHFRWLRIALGAYKLELVIANPGAILLAWFFLGLYNSIQVQIVLAEIMLENICGAEIVC